MTLQEILDLWVEKGAVYEWVSFDQAHLFWKHILLYEDVGPFNEEYISLSLNDILYWDSNFWKALFPLDWQYETPEYDSRYVDPVFRDWGVIYVLDNVSDAPRVRRWNFLKMQSTLHKDKVAYLSDLLSK